MDLRHLDDYAKRINRSAAECARYTITVDLPTFNLLRQLVVDRIDLLMHTMKQPKMKPAVRAKHIKQVEAVHRLGEAVGNAELKRIYE